MANRKHTRASQRPTKQSTPNSPTNITTVSNASPDVITQVDSPGKKGSVTLTAAMAKFTGPIPPPHLLGSYGEIDKSFPDRIMQMAERQETHRHGIEKWAVIGGTVLSFVGVVFALIISLAALYGGYSLIMSGHDVAGTIFGGGGLIGLVSVFIYGTRSRKKERQQKDAANRKTTGPK